MDPVGLVPPAALEFCATLYPLVIDIRGFKASNFRMY